MAEARPYHHGDLRRALIEAARRILEAEGPSALSLRAVAREAGVSPAAPYHHFKDKTELLEAVAQEGWEMLDEVIAKAKAEAPNADAALTEIGVGCRLCERANCRQRAFPPLQHRLMVDEKVRGVSAYAFAPES